MSIIRRLLVIATLSLLLASCGQSNKNSVNIKDYISLQDKNGHVIYYDMTHDKVTEMFATVPIDEHWELAHENISLYFTSWISNETATLKQMEVVFQEDHPSPSWSLPQGIAIGDTKSSVIDALDIAEPPGDILDLFFAQDSKYTGKMYAITEEELHNLPLDTTIYRIVFSFENNSLARIVLGDLESMA